VDPPVKPEDDELGPENDGVLCQRMTRIGEGTKGLSELENYRIRKERGGGSIRGDYFFLFSIPMIPIVPIVL